MPSYFNKVNYRQVADNANPYENRTKFYEHLERKLRESLLPSHIEILKKTEYRCRNCSIHFSDPEVSNKYQIHHVQPREYNGTNDK